MSGYPEICISRVLVHEGGFVNNPKDPGGPTNRGVTLATARALGIDVDGDGDTDIDDIRKLTEAEAIKVYRHFYWNPVHGDMIQRGVSYVLFDCAVNSGVGRSVMFLQQMLGGIPVDNSFGPKTMSALLRVNDVHGLIDKLVDRRLRFLQSIKNPKTGALLWKTFGKGWQARVDDVRRLAHEDYDAG